MLNVDSFFVSHFMPLGLHLIKKGYEVHVACKITQHKASLENLGFIVHDVSISRSGTSLLREFNTLLEMRSVIRLVDPHIVEFFTIKPVLYGGLITRFLTIPTKVFYITGLGHVFTVKGIKSFFLRIVVKLLYKFAFSGVSVKFVTENDSDKRLIRQIIGGSSSQIYQLNGVGVDLHEYEYVEELDGSEVVISMACRLLKDKGVLEYLESAKIIASLGIKADFQLFGDLDLGNPASLTSDELQNMQVDGSVSVYGYSSDIAGVFKNSNIVVLPSYREGFPKVLIEAAACGRAVITTDVPGCKDAIRPGVTGLLCKARDGDSLALGLEELIINKVARNEMGKAGRNLALEAFNVNDINEQHFEIYLD